MIKTKTWFYASPHHRIGIIVDEDGRSGEREAYIGVGIGKALEAQGIVATGTKVPAAALEHILNLLKGKGKIWRT